MPPIREQGANAIFHVTTAHILLCLRLQWCVHQYPLNSSDHYRLVPCASSMRLRNAGAQIAPTSRQVQYAHQRDQSSLYLVGACARFAILLCGAPKQQSFVSVVPTPDPDLVVVRLAMLRSLLDTYRKPPQMTRVVQIGRQPTRYGEVRGSILTHLMVICSSLSAA